MSGCPKHCSVTGSDKYPSVLRGSLWPLEHSWRASIWKCSGGAPLFLECSPAARPASRTGPPSPLLRIGRKQFIRWAALPVDTISEGGSTRLGEDAVSLSGD